MGGGEKTHECNEWGGAFSQLAPFIHHQRRHTGEKLLECSECRAFSPSSLPIEHQKTHNQGNIGNPSATAHHSASGKGLTLGKCPVSVSIVARPSVRAPILVRTRGSTGEKLHACRHCGKTSTHSSSLTKHQENSYLLHMGKP